MSKDEIKTEINKVLDHFSDKALEDLLSFLKNIEDKYSNSIFNSKTLDKILNEDKDLLERLAKWYPSRKLRNYIELSLTNLAEPMVSGIMTHLNRL